MIGKEAQRVLERDIGLTMSQIYDLDVPDEIAYVQAKTGKPLTFPQILDTRKIGRGNPLLARGKVTTMEEVNAKIDAMLQQN